MVFGKGDKGEKGEKGGEEGGGKKGLFGELLPEVRGQGKEGHVPPIVLETVAFLRSHDAVQDEGLFRVAGLSTTLDELRAKYDENFTVDLENFTPKPTNHDVASVLKTYIRSLAEPLFLRRFYRTIITVARNAENDDEFLSRMSKVLEKIPVANRDTLLFIMVCWSARAFLFVMDFFCFVRRSLTPTFFCCCRSTCTR
jgi:RhoGAP domain